jgi:histidinol-phosphate aminotransferase
MINLKVLVSRPDIEYQDVRAIDLSKNVHYDDFIVKAAQQIAATTNLSSYPDTFTLYNAICSYYNQPIAKTTIGYGATEILERIFKALSFKHISIVTPTFEMAEIYCKLYDKQYKCIPLELLHSDTNEVLYIANPSGLLGYSIDLTSISKNYKLCIVDESYSDFYKAHSMLNCLPDNVIIIKTLSKSLGLAGLRVGFAFASPSITAKLQEYRSNFVCNSLAPAIAQELIHHTPAVVNRMLKTKQYLENTYPTEPSIGNYVLFKKSNKLTDRFGYRLVNNMYRMALINKELL